MSEATRVFAYLRAAGIDDSLRLHGLVPERPGESDFEGMTPKGKKMGSTHPWKRHRFHANPDDYRPVKFPPPGPYWCSGEAGDGSYSIVVAYLPRDVDVRDWWPEATEIEATEERKIVFSDRFAKPAWWTGGAA